MDAAIGKRKNRKQHGSREMAKKKKTSTKPKR